MPKIKGISKLIDKVNSIQELIPEIRATISAKRDIYYGRSDKWQMSDEGAMYESDLNEAESFIDDIEGIEIPNID